MVEVKGREEGRAGFDSVVWGRGEAAQMVVEKKLGLNLAKHKPPVGGSPPEVPKRGSASVTHVPGREMQLLR